MNRGGGGYEYKRSKAEQLKAYGVENAPSRSFTIDFKLKTNGIEDWLIKLVEFDSDATTFFETLFAVFYVQTNNRRFRYSAVTFDEKVFNLVKNSYEKTVVSDYISMILLDKFK